MDSKMKPFAKSVSFAFAVAYLLSSGVSSAALPTAQDYVQDGLIHQWDGIENAGVGLHDATTMSGLT